MLTWVLPEAGKHPWHACYTLCCSACMRRQMHKPVRRGSSVLGVTHQRAQARQMHTLAGAAPHPAPLTVRPLTTAKVPCCLPPRHRPGPRIPWAALCKTPCTRSTPYPCCPSGICTLCAPILSICLVPNHEYALLPFESMLYVLMKGMCT